MEMESELLLPKPIYGGIKRYLRRRHYNLNEGTVPNGKKMKIIRLRRNPRRYWRIRTIPKLRWVIRSPLNILTRLKKSYMNFMLRSMISENIFGGKWIPKARFVFKDYSSDAFEGRLIYEISRALVASHQLHPM